MEIASVLASISNENSKSSNQQLGQDFDTFLTLLTTQLQYQDPLEPMDSTEFTNQLVSFSGVEQQIRTNESLENMLKLKAMDLTSVGIGYIGLDIEMTGNEFTYDGATPVNMSYTLPEDAAQSTISILDQNGTTVYTTSGETASGKYDFSWDGLDALGQPVPPGQYRISIGAATEDNTSLNVTTTVPGHVSGIESADNGEVLLLVGDKKVPITDVTKATETSL